MKMRTKITIGFAAVIVLFVIAAGLSIVSLNAASDGFNEYRALARDTNLAGRLQANMLMVRMTAKDFIITSQVDEHDIFDEYYTIMEEFMAEAQREIQDPERAALIDEADEKVIEYGEYFDEVYGEVLQIVSIQANSLDVIGPQIEKALTSILESAERDNDMIASYNAAIALRSILLARLYAAKFIDTSDPAAADRVRSEFSTAGDYYDILQNSLRNTTRRRLLANAIEMSDDYLANFNKLVAHINTRDDTIENHLDVIGPLVATDVEDVKLDVMKDQDQLGEKLQADNVRTVRIVLILSVFAILAGTIIAFYTVVSILKQLGEDPGIIESIMRDIALGDLDIKAKHKGTPQGVYLSVMNMVKALREKSDLLEQVAAGDLSIDVRVASEKDALGISLKTMTDSLNELLSQVNIAIDQVNVGSDQVSQSSQSLSQGATEQASSLEEISSSLNEINSQAQANADNAKEANSIATQASANASQGNELMQDLVGAMGEINTSSDEIQKVVKVIDDIAFQINLLALNANVEAARAGKYGKGFAVVAEEVRNLASRSAEAVKETTAMVGQTIESIGRGNNSAEQTAKQLSEIVDGSNKVAALLAEIATASDEQALGIGQITQGLDQIDEVTQGNTASAEESASAAEELASQATQLQSTIRQFKLRNSAQQLLHAPQKKQLPPKGKTLHNEKQKSHIQNETRDVRPVDPREVIDLESDMDYDRF